jgi:hypothetical protein
VKEPTTAQSRLLSGQNWRKARRFFIYPFRQEARPIAKRLTINLGPKVSMCLGLATGGLVVENPDG